MCLCVSHIQTCFLPTASMPPSRFPDISLSMLFSMSLPLICWYSWKTAHTHVTKHRKAWLCVDWQLHAESETQIGLQCVTRSVGATCSEVRFAPGTQNGIEFGLICSQLVFPCSVEGLQTEIIRYLSDRYTHELMKYFIRFYLRQRLENVKKKLV